MTSAAYGVGRDSIANRTAVDCPTQPFPKQNPYRKVCLRESLCTARPDLASNPAIAFSKLFADPAHATLVSGEVFADDTSLRFG